MGLSDGNKMKYRRRAPAAAQLPNGASDAAPAGHENQSQPEMNGKRMLQEEDYIFPLDEDQMVDTPTPTSSAIPPFGMSSFKVRKTSPSRLSNLTTPSPAPKLINIGPPPRSRYVSQQLL